MTTDTVKLFGNLEKITIDREGETKLTFLVPANHLVQVQEIAKMTECLLAIDVRMG